MVAFSHNEPNLIVTGYDKVRDNSLLIWDIKGAFGSTSTSNYGIDDNEGDYPSQRLKSPNSVGGSNLAPSSNTSDIKPIAQFGLSEQVSAATFLHSPRTLVAAMALKWIRCYDLRANPSSNSTATSIMSSRNVSSLVADPFDSHRFASVGEDGIVRMWDLRHNTEPILTFSSEDGIAKSDRHKKDSSGNSNANNSASSLARQASKLSLTPSSSTVTGGTTGTGATAQVAFSTTRRGHLATLDKDANHLSAWNMFEVESNTRNLTSKAKMSDQNMPDGAGLMLRSTSQDENAPLPTLYYERRSE